MSNSTATAVVCALLLAGCHGRGAPPVSPGPPEPRLPAGPRGVIEPDVSAVPTAPSGARSRPDQYRRLTAPECRAYAVAAAPFAADLDRHPESDDPRHPHVRKRAAESAAASRLVRGHAADELRNRAAGDALEDFYKLAEAEGQFDLLAAAHLELRAQLANAEKAERAGLKDRADIPALRRRLLDIEANQAKLEAGAGALNASLRARLGISPADPLPLWPADPLKVRPDDVDVEQAVATGLHYRSDLNLLRVLAQGQAGELANAVLTTLNPLLGKLKTDNPLATLLAPFVKEPERQKAAATARAVSALAARERVAEAEVRGAAVALRGHRAAVAARTLDVRQADARITELQTRQASGINVTADLATAKLDLLKAKGDLLSSVIEWHLTEVKLRESMGVLVRE